MSRLPSLFICLQAFFVLAAAMKCSEELAYSGWPSCANSCFSICDKYCPSSVVDFTCTCKTPAYIREAYACLEKSCSETDLQSITGTSAQACANLGYDISSYFSSTSSVASPTSTSPASSSTAAAAANGNQTTGKSGVPVGTVVGIALGIFFGLAFGVAAVWLCLRRRRQGATANGSTVQQTHGTHTAAPLQNWEDKPKQPELHGIPMEYRNVNPVQRESSHQTEVEGNTPGNAPGWKPLHELG